MPVPFYMILELLVVFGCAFFITFLVTQVVIEVANRNKLFDRPSERKIPFRRISSLGGIGILIGFLLTCLFFIPFGSGPEIRLFLAVGLMVFLVGLKDDVSDLSAKNKLFGQLLVAALLIHEGGLRLEGMYGLLGLQEVPQTFSYIITYMTVIVVMNAFNLIDGVDGLAGSLSLFSFTVFGIYFFQSGQLAYALMAFALGGTILSFLTFNFPPARIFMGDCGSLFIGTMNAIFVIRFIHTAADPGAVIPVSGAVAVGFAVLFVPLFDTFRVFTMRLLMGLSPFQPDRKHVHHLLLSRGYNHFWTSFICLVSNLLLLAGVWQFRHLGPTLVLLMEMLVGFAAVGIVYYGIRAPHRKSSETVVPVVPIEADAQTKVK